MIRYLLFSFLIMGCSARYTILPDSTEADIHCFEHKSTNVFLLKGESSNVLIDAGFEASQKALIRFLNAQGLHPEDIDVLILTHAHADHAGNAAMFQSAGVTVIGGARDLTDFNTGRNGKACPTSGTAWLGQCVIDKTFDPLTPDTLLDPGDTLRLDQPELEIFPLEGHTPGSLVVRHADRLFVGDLIRGCMSNSDQPCRHYFMCDLKDNNADIRSLLSMPGISTWYPGHFGPLSVEAVRSWVDKKGQ